MERTIRVYTLDVWGNAEDGFDVNERFMVGTITVAEDARDHEVWQALLDAGIAKGAFEHADFDDNGVGDCTIMDATDGRPVFHLEYDVD